MVFQEPNEHSMYWAIFYENGVERIEKNAMHKRITREVYLNLSDGIIEKELLLGTDNYRLLQCDTFSVSDRIANLFFVVCTVEKIDEPKKT